MSVFRSVEPKIDESVHVDPTARIVGDVSIGAGSSVWCHATIRGDLNSIRIGLDTNIQDGAVLHCSGGAHPLEIGDRVVVGHRSVLHGCTIRGPALIGIGSIILDGAIIEEDCLVAAGSLVSGGKIMPRGHLVLGNPARPVRNLSDAEIEMVRGAWRDYTNMLEEYRRSGFFRAWKENAQGND